jgi:hypothetical protein
MESSIENYQKNNKIEEGKRIVQNNEFLNDLSNLMENEEFKRFYDKHMTNWMDIKCTAIYMRLYSEFKDKYKSITDKELDRYVVVFLLRKIMSDKNLLPFSIKMVEKIQEEKWKSDDFWTEFENFMVIHNNINLLEDI